MNRTIPGGKRFPRTDIRQLPPGIDRSPKSAHVSCPSFSPMEARFEFDAVNRILLGRLDGHVTEELLADFYHAIRRYSVLTDAQAAIFDFTLAREVGISSEFIQRLARSEPAMLNVETKPTVAVVPQIHAFGLARMFQLIGERTRPLFQVVKTMDEALAVLQAQTSEFRPLDF